MEAKNLKQIEIDGETIHLKKGFLGWNVVYPSKINEKINWRNFIAGGSWWNLLGVAFIILLVLGCIYEYSIAIKSLNECAEQLPKFNLIP